MKVVKNVFHKKEKIHRNNDFSCLNVSLDYSFACCTCKQGAFTPGAFFANQTCTQWSRIQKWRKKIQNIAFEKNKNNHHDIWPWRGYLKDQSKAKSILLWLPNTEIFARKVWWNWQMFTVQAILVNIYRMLSTAANSFADFWARLSDFCCICFNW